MIKYLLCFAVLLPVSADAQNCTPERYRALMREADQAVQNGQYDMAINKLQSAKTCRPENGAAVDQRMVEVFLEVNKQRELAIQNAREAARQREIAETQRDLAVKNEKLASDQRDSTEQQRQIALENEREAKRQRDVAELARKAEADGRMKAEKSARANRLATYSLQEFRNNRYEMAWHSAVLAYQASIDSVTGGGTEFGVSGILNVVLSDAGRWAYQSLANHGEVQVSPNGKHLLTWQGDSTAHLWNNAGLLLNTIGPNVHAVGHVMYAPKGTRIVTFGYDNTIGLWDGSGNFIATLEGRCKAVKSPMFVPENYIMFSPDDQRFFHNGKLWDTNGALIKQVPLPEDYFLKQVVFSPDGKYLFLIDTDKLIISDSNGNIIKKINDFTPSRDPYIRFLKNKEQFVIISNNNDYPYGANLELRNFKGEKLSSISLKNRAVWEEEISSGGQFALFESRGDDSYNWEIWDLGKNTLTLLKSVIKAFISPDGTRILTIEENGIRIRDKTGAIIKALKYENKDQSEMALFSPDGKQVVTFQETDAQTFYLWDLNGIPLRKVEIPGFIQSPGIFFHPEGHYIMIASSHNIYYWHNDGRLTTDFLFDSDRAIQLNAVIFIRNGPPVFISTPKILLKDVPPSTMDHILLWQKTGLSPVHSHKFPHDITGASYSPDASYCVVVNGFSDGVARLLDRNWHELSVLKPPPKTLDGVDRAVFSPREQLILGFGMLDKKAYLWDFKGRLLQTFEGHSSALMDASFSPDGSNILTFCDDNTAWLWAQNGQLIKKIDNHSGRVYHAEFNPEGNHILTCSGDSTVRLWDKRGNHLRIIKHKSPVYKSVFSPDGKNILAVCQDKKIYYWDINGNLLATWGDNTDQKYSRGADAAGFTYKVLEDISFSPDGRYFLTRSNFGTLRLWTINGWVVRVLTGHDQPVEGAVFSPDSKYLISWSADKTVRLWDIKGNLLTTYGPFDDIPSEAVFSPDGKHILTTEWHGHVKIWESFPQYIKTNWSMEIQDFINAGIPLDPDSERLIQQLKKQ